MLFCISNFMRCGCSTFRELSSVSLHALSRQFIIPEARKKL